MKTEFLNWWEKVKPEVDAISELLFKELSDDPGRLIDDLVEIEAWYGRSGTLLSEAQTNLDLSRGFYLPPKEGLTDFDRKIKLDEIVSPFREARDKMESLHEAIKMRITLGQSLLSYMKQSLENNKFIK